MELIHLVLLSAIQTPNREREKERKLRRCDERRDRDGQTERKVIKKDKVQKEKVRGKERMRESKI